MTAPQDLTATDSRLADQRRIEALIEIVARLRDPEHGCPWDLKQSFASIVPHTLEETYEVAESIELGDMVELRDELGDLLFQVAIYARMAQEQGEFDFGDVVESICQKMIRRHPHVFGDAKLDTADDVRRNWEAIKTAERQEKSSSGPDPNADLTSVLDGVTRALPALVRATKLQKRAAHVGFDWDDAAGVIAKVREELAECEQAIDSPGNADALLHEAGDLLFSCVNLARHLGVDAEQALRTANHRFERRFRFVEAGLQDAGQRACLEQRQRMEQLWESAKTEERRCAPSSP